MSSSKDQMAELMKSDLYEVLGVEPMADQKIIKRAYRKEALKCHPDKNQDDPQAAELFLKLSKVLEILTDPEARGTYDKLLKARQAAALRTSKYDSKRKKLKDDLEARERAAESGPTNLQRDMDKLQATIDRLRKEGSRQLQEEQKLMREQLLKERETLLSGMGGAAAASCRVKVRWDAVLHDYDQDSLTFVLQKYGDISVLLVSTKKAGSALVEFCSASSAANAARFEQGTPARPLRLKLLETDQSEKTAAPASGHVIRTGTVRPADSRASFDTFESLVLRNMRQAEERKKLIEQLQEEDG